MVNKLDSTTLFLAQTCNHAEELAGLLAVGTLEPIEPHIAERAILSTNMLANSAALMELAALETFLRGFEALLTIYRDRRLPWDERIAQLTSEVVEKEDHFVASSKGKHSSTLKSTISADELEALCNELAELTAFAGATEPGHAADAASVAAAGDTSSRPAGTDTAEDHAQHDRPLARSLGDLRRHTQELLAEWESADWNFETQSPEAFQRLRKELFSINFHALSIEQMIGIKTGDQSAPRLGFLAPIRSAVDDFSKVLCAGSNRQVEVNFIGKDSSLDVRLLSPLVRVLQCMIGDVFVRCQEEYLRVEVVVQEQNGAFVWSLRDNGNNFITDSPLDPDEYMAFYPGLRETCRVLSKLHSLLWVEPDENHDVRFAFSMPRSPEGETFMVWGEGTQRFAILSNQVSDVLALDEVEVMDDARGEYLMYGGSRVAVARLDQVYDGAPDDDDRIAVIGYLEKRVALYVGGNGDTKEGQWLKNAVPAWRGLRQGVAEIEQKKIPLIEANALLTRYVAMINDTSIAGGTMGQEPGPPQVRGDVVLSDEDDSSIDCESYVLVVERSEALRNMFAGILAQKQLKAKLVDQIDAATDCLDEIAPSLIISEFRVPSMAAKILVERVKAQGRDIPVLVTTTQDGEKAELLVEKLGVAGYLSKPLDSAEVLTRIEGFLERQAARAPRT
ncbi:MAG: response regulator [Candidatus Krumholzibacteria bacterium]|nr:response regulator [Candidatus Krumholzibacteria bacterium]